MAVGAGAGVLLGVLPLPPFEGWKAFFIFPFVLLNQELSFGLAGLVMVKFLSVETKKAKDT